MKYIRVTDSISMAHGYRSVQAQLQTSSPSVGYLHVPCILQSQTSAATAIIVIHPVCAPICPKSHNMKFVYNMFVTGKQKTRCIYICTHI